MTTPTLEQAKEFFLSDMIISNIADSRITYWINDIFLKGIVNENDWGNLFFNGYMNLLGHYLYFYEAQVVPASGALMSSDRTSKVSRSFAVQSNPDDFKNTFYLTKYGRIYLQLRAQLAIIGGGFVSFGGNYV